MPGSRTEHCRPERSRKLTALCASQLFPPDFLLTRNPRLLLHTFTVIPKTQCLVDAFAAAARAAGTRIAQLSSVRKRYRQELAARLSVLQRTNDNLHVHAGCQRL